MSGFRMANILRNELKLNTPIIFLTAKDTENDLLTGFSAGGDDYISKPFSLHEVLARIRAVLRRTKDNKTPQVLKVGNLTIDFAKKLVFSDDENIRLSPKSLASLACWPKSLAASLHVMKS